jgi:Tetratricopeptide repeat
MRLAKSFGVLVLPMLMGISALAQTQPSSQQSPQPASQSNKQSTPAPATPPAKKPDTAQDNPFPEDISKKAAEGADSTPDVPPSSSAPSDSSAPPRSAPDDSTSSSRSKFQGMGDLTSEEVSRISNGAGGYIVNPKMATEDVKVGGFYLAQHDYKGAYVRFKEATLVDPENADAVFGLAEAARGMNHKDEAVQNYLVYLDASPDGKKAKEARKALAELGAPPSPKK